MDIKQAISAIRNNWPPSNYTMLREALEMSIKSLEAEESAQTAHNSTKVESVTPDCTVCGYLACHFCNDQDHFYITPEYPA